MPLWAFIPLILVAMLACPISMWVIDKFTRRKMSCAACNASAQENHIHTPEELKVRKAALEREIAEVTREIEARKRVTGVKGSGVGRG
jgi:hypothetical protein